MCILGLRRVGDVASVREGALDETARRQSSIDAELHVLEVVERVEDAEDVDATVLGLGAKLVDDVIGVRGVTDGVGAAEEHLEGDVWHLLAQLLEALPRALVEEAHRDVKGGAAPHLHRESLLEGVRRVVGACEELVGAHPRREKRLVGVAPATWRCQRR